MQHLARPAERKEPPNAPRKPPVKPPPGRRNPPKKEPPPPPNPGDPRPGDRPPAGDPPTRRGPKRLHLLDCVAKVRAKLGSQIGNPNIEIRNNFKREILKSKTQVRSQCLVFLSFDIVSKLRNLRHGSGHALRPSASHSEFRLWLSRTGFIALLARLISHETGPNFLVVRSGIKFLDFATDERIEDLERASGAWSSRLLPFDRNQD